MVPAVSSGVGRRIDRPTNKSSFESPHLQKVSDVLKSVEVPEAILINIVVAPAMPIEAAQFWEMIDMYVYRWFNIHVYVHFINK